MSRCFPFPPPGYEKKPRSTEHGDLLAKEKHKEKKHKKEKKDKEKGESKQRKDKDRSKDKQKEKKDRKGKHKDKKKDKDKSKTPEDRRTEHQSQGYDSRKTEDVRDSKFTEELGRRIRDEGQEAANRMDEDFSATTHRRTESMGKESVTGNKMVTDVTCAIQRRNDKLAPSFRKRTEGMETAATLEKQKVACSENFPDCTAAERRRTDNLTPPMQKRIESVDTSIAMEKERTPSNQNVGDFISAEQRRNHVTSHQVDDLPSSVQRRTEDMFTVCSMQKERVANNNMASPSIGATKGNNGMDQLDQLVESLASSVPGRSENMVVVPAMGKERSLFPNIIRTEQRRTDAKGLPVEKDRSAEKDAHKKKEGMEKTKEKKTEDGKREGHKDRDRNEKKRKEKDRHKEKKREEKTRGKGDHKHTKHDKLRESGMKDQIDSLNNKTLPLHIENVKTAGADGNNKKRKELEINGFLHEPQHDRRPNKLPKTSASSSHTPMENGSLELTRIPSPCASVKLGVVSDMKVERSLNNSGSYINGKAEVQPSHLLRPTPIVVDSGKSNVHVMKPEVQPSHALRPPISLDAVDSSKSDQVHVLRPDVPLVAVDFSKSGHVPSIPPHPDTKFLSTVYSVPKMVELLESDDLEWLFGNENPQFNTKLEVEGALPQVWAKGLQIEGSDVFALPYVIPF